MINHEQSQNPTPDDNADDERVVRSADERNGEPDATQASGVYLCSASTVPGAGVNGMAGFHAATRALRWIERH